MISGTRLSANSSFLIADSAQQFTEAIHKVMPMAFSESMIEERKTLNAHF